MVFEAIESTHGVYLVVVYHGVVDGRPPTLYDPRPCLGWYCRACGLVQHQTTACEECRKPRVQPCGHRVRLLTGVCEHCGTQHLRPQPGPQEQFLACPADVVLFGGGVGSGKSYSLLLDAACYQDVPGWVGGIFRSNHKDLTGGAGVFAKAKKMFSDATEAAPRRQPQSASRRLRFRESSPMDMRWPSGATLEFRHLDEENYEDYQGLEYAWIGLEEATHYEWHWVRYLITRLRTDTGVKTLVRMTCNPDRSHWLREWVDWYLLPSGYPDRAKSGVLRYFAMRRDSGDMVWADTQEECAELADRDPIEVQSFSYIASLFDDNKILKSIDPTYVARQATGGADEERLRHGNWNASAEVGGMLRRSRWGNPDGLVNKPLAQIVRWVRAWDKAATRPTDGYPNPSYTVGVLMGWDIHGRFYLAGLVACREEPPEVAELQRQTAIADGKKITQCAKKSGGDQGKSDHLNTVKILRVGGGRVTTMPELKNKVVRVQPMADALMLGMSGNVPATKYDPKNWQPRGWILNPDAETAASLGIPHCANWYDAPYHDAGAAPKTLGDLWWSHAEPFFDPKKKNDAADAAGDAYAILSAPPPPDLAKAELARWRMWCE